MPHFCIQYDLNLPQIRINGSYHQQQRMTSSGDISNGEGFNDTNSPAGVSITYQEALDSIKKSPFSQPYLKPRLDQKPSAISTTSNASTSLLSVDEVFSPHTFDMTDKHEMILDNIRRGDEWHQNLERVHLFTEAESCECFSRAGKYLHCNEFPDGAVNAKLFPHAREGWVFLKEARRLGKAYPQELMDLGRRSLAEGKRAGVF
jgi:hypothetical protein